MKVILSESYGAGRIRRRSRGNKRPNGQPPAIQKQLKITPKTKVILYRKDDKLVLAKLNLPPIEELKDLFREIDRQNKGKKLPTDQEILEEIHLYRRSKLTKQGS